MKLLYVRRSDRKGKKFVAKFSLDNGSERTVHFGSVVSTTFSEGASESKKSAYLARHKVRENWNDPLSAGALSRWIAWNKRSLRASIADFKKRFKL